MKAKRINEVLKEDAQVKEWQENRDHLYNRTDYDKLDGGEKLLFKIDEVGDYGRTIWTLGVFRAKNGDEARELAAEHFNNKEIVTTGFYAANEVSERELKKEVAELEKQIAKLKIIN